MNDENSQPAIRSLPQPIGCTCEEIKVQEAKYDFCSSFPGELFLQIYQIRKTEKLYFKS